MAELQNELSQDQLDAITTQLRLGSGTPGGAAPLPKDEQGAHIRERSHFVDLLETRFQLTQARLSLLRSMGRIEDWAKAAPAPAPSRARSLARLKLTRTIWRISPELHVPLPFVI